MDNQIPETTVENAKNYKTIFKAFYWLNKTPLNFFFNFSDKGTFSFVILKGKFPYIFNLTNDEKLPFVKAVLRNCSADEIAKALKEIKEE